MSSIKPRLTIEETKQIMLQWKYLLKGVRTTYLTGHSGPFIKDLRYFDQNEVTTGCKPEDWELSKEYNQLKASTTLTHLNKKLETEAFLIVKDSKIIYEKYGNALSKDSYSNSFSMAKSITVAILFRCISEGHIESLNTKAKEFITNLSGEYANELTLGDLASMSAGISWEEHYKSPFSDNAKAFFSEDIKKVMQKIKVVNKPGEKFEYQSGATQLLGMCIEIATQQSLSELLSIYFWKPLGMRQNAKWQVDSFKSNVTKCYCCISSNARDFARFGLLWQQNGYWNGQQLIPKELAILAQKPKFKTSPQYGYGLWLSQYKGKNISYMRGILGQYVINIPEDQLIIVRLGNKRYTPDAEGNPGKDFYTYIDETYNMLKKNTDES